MTIKGWNWKHTLGVLWVMTFLVLGSIILAIYSISQGWWGYIPPISELQNPINKSATRIYTDDGKLEDYDNVVDVENESYLFYNLNDNDKIVIRDTYTNTKNIINYKANESAFLFLY